MSIRQNFAVDEDDNMLYYINGKTIYQVDLSTKEESVYKDFSDMGSSREINLNTILYNPFDKDVYCYADEYFPVDPGTRMIFNLRTEEFWENDDFYAACFIRFTEKDKVLVDKGLKVVEISINTGKKTEIQKPSDRASCCEPFTYDDCYYWVNAEFDYSRLSIIDREDVKDKFDGILEYTIYNDDVYIMKKDFSIYKVNMEKLLNPSGSGNTLSSLTAENDALELYIDVNDIKQTKSYIGKLTTFTLTASGDVVVYDKQDNILKLIEKNF